MNKVRELAAYVLTLDEPPPPEFWKCLTLLPMRKLEDVISAFGVQSPIKKGPLFDTESSEEDEPQDDPDEIQEDPDESQDEAEIQDDPGESQEDDPDESQDEEQDITPDDESKVYSISIDGESDDYFQLVKWKRNGFHEIAWLYTPQDLYKLTGMEAIDVFGEGMQKIIERVENITSVALVYTDHTQVLRAGNWKDVTDNVFTARIIPDIKLPQFQAYIIGEYSFGSGNVVTDEKDTVALMVDNLLTIGPGGGQKVKELTPKIGKWGTVPEGKDGICWACNRTRHITKTFKINGRRHQLGKYCFGRMHVASKLLKCKSRAETTRLMDKARVALTSYSTI
jgi:hypothetical protein